MEYYLTCSLWSSNSNKKCRKCFRISDFNVVLKNSFWKLRVSCHENISNPLNIKIKQMMRYLWLSLKQVYFLDFVIFLPFWPLFYDGSWPPVHTRLLLNKWSYLYFYFRWSIMWCVCIILQCSINYLLNSLPSPE